MGAGSAAAASSFARSAVAGILLLESHTLRASPMAELPTGGAPAPAIASGGGPSSDGAAMSLKWVFGFSRDVALQNLCDANRSAVLYASAHTGVLYDLTSKTQRLLQGHVNPISCTCASADRRWAATADRGPGSVLVVWDTYTGAPVKTIASPHPNGVRAMDMSPDARYLVTLSEDDAPQTLSVWDCHALGDGPLHTAEVGGGEGDEAAAEAQACVRFDPSDPCSILSSGPSAAIFWSWHDGALAYYAPPLGERDFQQPVRRRACARIAPLLSPLTPPSHLSAQVGALTASAFIPGTRQAISTTADGDAVLWDCVDLPEVATADRRAVKLVKLHSGAIHALEVCGELIVTAGADGHVRVYDFNFRVVAWFEDLDAGPITSLSFAHQPGALKKLGDSAPFTCPDFVVGTANALVISCTASMFEQGSADARRGTLLVQGQDAPVHGLAAHPLLTRFACSGHSGLLQLWDYSEQRLLLMRMFDKLLGHCLAFSPNGKLLAAGFTNGTVKLLAGMTLEEIATFRVSRECITQVRGMRHRHHHHHLIPLLTPSPLHPHPRSPSRTTRRTSPPPTPTGAPPSTASPHKPTSPPPAAPSESGSTSASATTAAPSNSAPTTVPLTTHLLTTHRSPPHRTAFQVPRPLPPDHVALVRRRLRRHPPPLLGW